MSRHRLTLALTRFRETSEEFDATLADLRQEMLTMNARLRAFDRQMGDIGRGIDELHGKSVALGRIMDRAMQPTVKKDHSAEATAEVQLEAITYPVPKIRFSPPGQGGKTRHLFHDTLSGE